MTEGLSTAFGGLAWTPLATDWTDKQRMTTATTTSPPRLPIPNALQLTMNLTHSGQAAAIVLGARVPSGSVGFTQSAVEAWRDATWSAFRALMHYDVVCTGAVARATVVDGVIFELGPPPTNNGAMTGGRTPAASCTLLRWRTAQGGRSGRGRTFLPGLPMEQVDTTGRGYVTAHANQAAASISAYLGSTVFTSDSLKPAVLSFRKGAAYDITTGAIASIVGIQRRRMR